MLATGFISGTRELGHAATISQEPVPDVLRHRDYQKQAGLGHDDLVMAAGRMHAGPA